MQTCRKLISSFNYKNQIYISLKYHKNNALVEQVL